MAPEQHQRQESDTRGRSYRLGSIRPLSVFLVSFLVLTQIPVAAAHGATATAGLSQGHGVLFALVGVVLLGGILILKRTDQISPTVAIYGVFIGIAVTVVGAILFEGLSSDPTYSASSMPFPRS